MTWESGPGPRVSTNGVSPNNFGPKWFSFSSSNPKYVKWWGGGEIFFFSNDFPCQKTNFEKNAFPPPRYKTFPPFLKHLPFSTWLAKWTKDIYLLSFCEFVSVSLFDGGGELLDFFAHFSTSCESSLYPLLLGNKFRVFPFEWPPSSLSSSGVLS